MKISPFAKVGLILALCIVAVFAQQFALPNFPTSTTNVKYYTGLVPTTLTGLAGGGPGYNTVVNYLSFNNFDPSATATITVQDGSTNCSNGPCDIFGPLTLAAGTKYTVQLGTMGEVATSGLFWKVTGTANVYGFAIIRF